MPSTVRTVSRLWLALAGAILIIGALAIALIAVVQSNAASTRATSTADCVNRTQADRARVNNLIRDAQLADTRAELAYERRQISVKALTEAKAKYELAQRAAKAYSDAHPAGRC